MLRMSPRAPVKWVGGTQTGSGQRQRAPLHSLHELQRLTKLTAVALCAIVIDDPHVLVSGLGPSVGEAHRAGRIEPVL